MDKHGFISYFFLSVQIRVIREPFNPCFIKGKRFFLLLGY